MAPAAGPAGPAGPASPSKVTVKITLIQGGITNVETPIAIGARYDGLPFAGPTAAFDRILDSWLTRAVDFGIIGSALGLLFPINFEQYHKAGKVKARNLILAGLGEPGRFAQDSLQLVMSNIIVAVISMGQTEFAAGLIGTRRKELSIADAIRGFLQGILDGYERLRSVAGTLKEDRENLRRALAHPLSVLLVHSEKTGAAIERELQAVSFEGLELTFGEKRKVDEDEPEEESIANPAAEPVTYMRVTRAKSGLRASRERAAPAPAPVRAALLEPFPCEVFQFSALSELAVIPQREQEVNARLLREAAERITKDRINENDHERLGAYFADTVIPEDFRKLTEGAANLTVEVDEGTAIYPWEMMAHKRFAKTSFVSQTVAVSRQFRSLLSPPPTSPPPLNNQLKVLVIADPAGDDTFSLPKARREGLAVVDVLEKANLAWGGRYKVEVTVRIGPGRDRQAEQMLDVLRTMTCVKSASQCDPLELAMLIVHEQQDLIHYAGHGIADPETGQTGWVFGPDCILSAKEIFRVRQVPRLVFANACFSAVTRDTDMMRKHMTGLAQAFFARGIPNFIGAGWTVDDACAEECARWFYAKALGLQSPDKCECDLVPMTIGDALKFGRQRAYALKADSSSWGAYQHYGNANDRLVVYQEPPPQDGRAPRKPAATAAAATAAGGARATERPSPSPSPTESRAGPPSVAAPAASVAEADRVCVNGIDFNTGQYAVPPQSLDEIARQVFRRPGLDKFSDVRADEHRAFPFGVDLQRPEKAGWGVIFHDDTPQEVRAALQPLIEHRRKSIPATFLKELDYKKDEQTRDWYRRHGVSPGAVDPPIVPYYLLVVGGPDLIPFDFQYLLGVDYAVGRLAFDTADEYDRHVRSIIAYETADAVPNVREIAYWGTRHANDAATELSASLLIDPLANGLPGSLGQLSRPIHEDVHYQCRLIVADDATKGSLLTTLHRNKPPAVLFTASHGLQLRSGQPGQATNQGALLCQDWTGFGSVKPAHLLAATDVPDDANVNGMVALMFACFGVGTPDNDQFVTDMSLAGKAPLLAPKPFMSALPRRLLTHPNGGALAVIGHIDRAWSYSILTPKTAGPQILAFRNSLGFIMSGAPLGFALSTQFGARYAALSALLATATSPTTPPAMRLSDRDLVTSWIQRNDAQNYVLLGDPAVRIRADALA